MIRPEKQLALRQKMADLGIKESDIEERFLTPGTKGGQKANKTACAVQLKHLITGTEAKSNKSRSREDNRFFARRILADKIEVLKTGKNFLSTKDQRKRKQKQRRHRRSASKTNNET